ncbi:MAG: hypothetical protein ACYTDU_11450 [Planctomycetota bacterium]
MTSRLTRNTPRPDAGGLTATTLQLPRASGSVTTPFASACAKCLKGHRKKSPSEYARTRAPPTGCPDASRTVTCRSAGPSPSAGALPFAATRGGSSARGSSMRR